MAAERMLNPLMIREVVKEWLLEDTPPLDFGGGFFAEESLAELKCKSSCVLAGRPFFDQVFHQLGCKVEWKFGDGDRLEAPCVAATVIGQIQNILLGERTGLNILCRASGIATLTADCVALAADKNWRGRVAATRKTTPGFRLVEKYAVLVGGGDCHRYGLGNMIMLKDNHIKASGGDIAQAIKNARRWSGFSQKIEVETSTVDEALAAAENGADIVMLDNFSPQKAKEAADVVKARFPGVILECSGGIGKQNLANYFSTCVDVISMSCLTQGYPAADFSVKITK